jgi:UDP-N-acetylmuramate--alanine ligase
MSGIAEVLLNQGYCISGSDLNKSSVTKRLEDLGATIFYEHSACNVDKAEADVVVISTAISGGNPEVLHARSQGIPVVSRAMMLAELMRLKMGIAVAGTHGKTTTTSFVSSVLAEADLDPTFVIGGKLNSAGTNAYLGKGDYIVVEADESDASFLNLLPVMAIVTNIDVDHMDTYGHDEARLRSAFVQFTQNLPFYGTAILCVDDDNVKKIIPFISRPIVTYGFDEEADYRAINVRSVGPEMHFTALRRCGRRRASKPLDIVLNLPGRHNVLNALASIALATEIGVEDEAIIKSLKNFNGVGRRFSFVGEIEAQQINGGGKYTLIDDYGHHPVEMQATIEAARGAWPDKRLVLAFQPHRYSRTRDCFEEFVRVLGLADEVLLTDVYAAGELPLNFADGKALTHAIEEDGKVRPQFVPNVEDLPEAIHAFARDGDIVITMGAGSISKVPSKILETANG